MHWTFCQDLQATVHNHRFLFQLPMTIFTVIVTILGDFDLTLMILLAFHLLFFKVYKYTLLHQSILLIRMTPMHDGFVSNSLEIIPRIYLFLFKLIIIQRET